MKDRQIPERNNARLETVEEFFIDFPAKFYLWNRIEIGLANKKPIKIRY